MLLEHLSLLNYRNLAPNKLRLDGQSAIFLGPNGSGKTNILEAFCLCATGRSLDGAKVAEMIQHEAKEASLALTFQKQHVRHEVEVGLRPQGKRIRVDGRALSISAELLDWLNVVSFFPDDLRVVRGSPEHRRRFLDRITVGQHPHFLQDAVAYHRALKARNGLLREGNPDLDLLRVFDRTLAKHGAQIHRARKATTATLALEGQNFFAESFTTTDAFGLTYWPGFKFEAKASEDIAAIEESLLGALQGQLRLDQRRGFTQTGPHRADLAFSLQKKPARAFASQGEQRGMILALKLAELSIKTKQMGTPPILLLDDVSSELDLARVGGFFAQIKATGCQLLATSTGAAALPWPSNAQRFAVANGQIQSILNG